MQGLGTSVATKIDEEEEREKRGTNEQNGVFDFGILTRRVDERQQQRKELSWVDILSRKIHGRGFFIFLML